MTDEIELISNRDGLAVIGDPTAVERFLSSAGVTSKELALHKRLGSTLSTGSTVAQAGSDVAANAGRWVKLTEQSAAAMKVTPLMKGSSSGVNRAVLTTDKGGARQHRWVGDHPGWRCLHDLEKAGTRVRRSPGACSRECRVDG